MMELQPVKNSVFNKPLPLHKVLDNISAVCALGGAIIGTLTQSTAIVAFPLASAVCVQIFNHRRLREETTQHYETLIRQQNLHIVNHQNSIKTLSEQLQQLPQEWQEKLEQENQANQKHFERQEQEYLEKYLEMQKLIAELSQSTENLEVNHQQLADVVNELRQIENFSQSLQTNSDAARNYYQRGLSHQRLGDKQGAIADFTQAIKSHSLYVEAYYARGVLHAALGDRKAAVYDLREAAKLYFDGGDLENYQKARDLARDLYNLDVKEDTTDTTSEQVLVANLFDYP